MDSVLFFPPTRKETKTVNFSNVVSAQSSKTQARALLIELNASRSNLVKSNTVPDASVLKNYLSLLLGLVYAKSENTQEGSLAFRNVAYHWSSNYGTLTKSDTSDPRFEAASVMISYAFLLMDRSSTRLTSEKELNKFGAGTPAKSSYDDLRAAAGMFRKVRATWSEDLQKQMNGSSDVHSQILEALESQCLAEAQEITVAAMAKALKGRKSNLQDIISLSQNTSALFEKASHALGPLRTKSDARLTKWAYYLEFKRLCYSSLSHIYSARAAIGLTVDGEDAPEGDVPPASKTMSKSTASSGVDGTGLDCGRALKHSEHALALLDKEAAELFTAYQKDKTPGPNLKESPFFQKTRSSVYGTCAKCRSLNSLVYYHTVPDTVPPLPTGASRVEIEPFELPPVSPLWTDEIYKELSALAENASVIDSSSDKDGKDKNGKGKKDKKDEKKKGGCGKCCRILLLCLVTPLLILISLLGIVVWLFLLPVKCLCPPLGCAVQLAANIFEGVVKAPLKAIKWALQEDDEDKKDSNDLSTPLLNEDKDTTSKSQSAEDMV